MNEDWIGKQILEGSVKGFSRGGKNCGKSKMEYRKSESKVSIRTIYRHVEIHYIGLQEINDIGAS